MKRLIVAMLSLVFSLSLFAQEEQYKSFASKFENKDGYEVTSIGRMAIRAASLAADSKTRSVYRKINSMVGVVCTKPDGMLESELKILVKDYKQVLDFAKEEGSALGYMNSAGTGLVFLITTPNEQTALLLEGEGLNYKDFLPEEVKQ